MIRPVAADGRIEAGGPFTPIHRQRVVARFESAATQRIVLIVAPAGYGKSVALRQYLETSHEEHVRYDVHEEHVTLLGFVRGLADALHEAAPDARKTLSGAYEKSRSSKTPGVDLAMWMHAHIKTYTGIIAIDDLHIAENDPEICRFVVSLIERTKGRTRWMLASRSSLDLPVGSWLAYGEMDLGIDEQDLRFTIDEARETAKASRVAVRDDELHEILAMTEGWPTALSFAVRSSMRSVDLRNIAASTREMVYRYLAEQVYESLEEEERDLLHFVGYLSEVDINVLRRAGYANAKAIVEHLRDRVAFIYPERPNVYRCHDLFRDFLQHQVELQGDGAVELVRRRVASALEGAGYIAASLELYASIPSETDILRLLEAHGFSLMDRAHSDVIGVALEAVSHEVRAVNPLVLGLRAVREGDAGRFDRAESLLQRALQRTEDKVLRADLAIRLALLFFKQGRDYIALLEPLDDPDIPETLRATAAGLLAPAYAYANRREDALSAMSAAEKYAGAIDSEELRAKTLHRMGITAMSLSLPFERVSALYSRAQALASDAALYGTAAHAFGGLATVSLLYEDDSAKSAWYAQQAMTAAMKAGDRFSMQTALIQLIDIEVRRGNAERLSSLEQQLAIVSTSDASRLSYIIPVRATVAAWEGRFEEAYRLMATISDRSFYDFDRMLNSALHAIYAVACGKRERSLELITRTLQWVGETESPYLYGRRWAEIARLLCAVAESLNGRLTAAARIVQRRAEGDGPPVEAVRNLAAAVMRVMKNPVLVDELTEYEEQLQSLGLAGIGRVVEKAVLICLHAQKAETPVQAPLTRAEADVLEALAAGQSPKDIAQETGRSVYTIQAHIQNAIRKLGCRGRNEALTVARRRGLVG